LKDSNTRELIKLYKKTKSKKALDVLIINFQPLLSKISGSLPNNVIDYNDKISFMNEMLVKLLSEYDLRYKIKVVTYLYQKLRFRLIDEIRKNEKYKLGMLHENIAYDEGAKIDDDVKQLLYKRIAELPRTEQIITGCILVGTKVKDIAEQTGVTEQMIYNYYNKAKEKLKITMRDEYYA